MGNIIKQNIRKIREYTALHRELWAAHHFLYDSRINRECATIEFIVMGINPGETDEIWEKAPKKGDMPLEETSDFDFHDEYGRDDSGKQWFKKIELFLRTTNVSLTECFFWSSSDMNQFRTRYGKLSASRHLPFCVELNRQLIALHNPRAIVFPGISYSARVSKLYSLAHVQSLSQHAQRLVEHYHDGDRPWFFTKHWSGAFGFSNEQRCAIRDYISANTLSARSIDDIKDGTSIVVQ
jgi:hypothetical protein